jgi:TRAP-type mannitol/chloroaromatic compound transport system substrate-binding protein
MEIFMFKRLLERVAVTAALAALLSASGSVCAEERVRWRMQSAFPSHLSVLGEVSSRFEGVIERMSGGTLEIRFFEPGALVPTLEAFDAVKAGSLDAMWGTPGFHAGKIPALTWFSAVPFGPRAGEYLAWLRYGGGGDIYDEIYEGHGLKGLFCSIIAPESSGWFREEISSIDDFKGLKIRFFGLGAKIMGKVGASTQLLAPVDIYPALERGVIDAAEYSMPSIDRDLGFHEVAKHNYFPGWHQQASAGELLMNAAKWEALSDQHKAMIETACGDSLQWSFVRSEAVQHEAMRELQDKGVTFHRWPDDVLEALRARWQEVIAEESAADPLFRRAYESYTEFREDYAIWRDHGYLD